MKLNPELTVKFIQMFYNGLLRQILVKVVVDSKYSWDDSLLELADEIFGYEKKGVK